MRVGGEAEPAIFLRNDHREEFSRFQEIPDLGRQVVPLPIDLPIVEHAAQLLDRAVEELLLLLGKPGGRESEELLPVRVAGEQIGVPPDVAGLDRFALGVGEMRQGMLRHAEDRLGDPVSPEGC